MKELKYKKYYHCIYETERGFDINLCEVENKEYPCINGSPFSINNVCGNTCYFAYPGGCGLYIMGKKILEEFKQQKFIWKDIVEIRGEYHYEEFPISGLMDDELTYQIDDFLDSVGRKYNVYPGNIKTYMMDGIDFGPKKLSFGAESCGCYINGVPEECYE